jgi:ATP-dependent protease ClpP protease subunit
MAHSVSSGTWGKVSEMENNVKETKRLNSLLIDILADRTKMSKEFWEKEIKHEDKFYNKATCKKMGIL